MIQVVIPAAGSSTRTYPLTSLKGKPLLKVCNKTIIERNLDEIKSFVDEAIIIVGYHGKKIVEFMGDNYKGLPIKYVWQEKQTGWAEAINLCRDMIKDKFIIMGGDDLYSGKDIKKCLKHSLCALVKEVEDPSRFGVIIPKDSKSQKIESFIEKPKEYVSNLASILLFMMDKRYFEIAPSIHESGEYHPANIFEYLAQKYDFHYEIVKDFWIPIGYPWDFLNANKFFLNREVLSIKESADGSKKRTLTSIIRSIFSNGSDRVVAGKKVKILPGTYIEGPVLIGEGCTIGPNCRIRGPVSIGNFCNIGQGADIKSSVIGDSTKIGHFSVISDSVVGSYVNIGAGTITANVRHDEETIKVPVKGKMEDTKMKKLGAIIGDYVKTGIGTLIYPGRVIEPFTWIPPGKIVK